MRPEAFPRILEAEAEVATAVLSESRDGDTALKLAVGASVRAERTFLPLFEGVACKAGCAWCCRGLKVDVTAVEALTIAQRFRTALAPEKFAAMASKVS